MRTAGIVIGFTIALGCAFARGQQLNPAQGAPQNPTNFESSSTLTLAPPEKGGIWADGVGEGLRQGSMEFEAAFGAGWGIRDGSEYRHDIALAELRVGRIVSRVFGKGCWYQGNFEVLIEAFAGSQINIEPRYFAGIGPVLRYEFATGTRCVPFIDGTAGVTGTDIGHPDLGANFEFDLQGGPGVKYYFNDRTSLIFQYRYVHFSNAGLYENNHGVNVQTLLLGFSCAF